jgi:hypothetical protein
MPRDGWINSGAHLQALLDDLVDLSGLSRT